MMLNPLSFNALLGHLGQLFGWQRAFACPCLNANSGSPNPACPVCKGKGRTWVASVDGDAGIAGAKVQREWAMMGQWEQGDVCLTIPSNSALYAMGQFDRVTMKNSSSPFSKTLANNTQKLDFAVTSVDRVFWIAAGVIVEGGIPTVGSDGALAWAVGQTPPPDGVQFNITGRKVPEYFCFTDLPQDRAHHHGLSLPRKVVLRKFDLFGRK